MGSLEPDIVNIKIEQELDDSGYGQEGFIPPTYRGQARFLDLSDDVLLCILRLCTPRDLKALGHTCRRLGSLICDRTLWQRVDARSQPTGMERLRWFLTYGLSSATQELQLTGYVDRNSRCLGIQDLTWPVNGELGRGHTTPGMDVDHFLLRMWYPHLPRYAMSPRWPDRREAAGKIYARTQEKLAQRASSSKASNSNSGDSNSKSNGDASKSGGVGHNSGNGRPIPKHWKTTKQSCRGPQFTFDQSLMKTLRTKCQNLSTLVLEYCNLDYKYTNLRHFPPKLKKLSLKGTRCYNLPLNTSFLGKVQERLPKLEYLDVSECDWFEPASLMPLSKVPRLKNLYMKKCRRLTECVAYASLATRYGFQQLKVLDVRGSPVGDSEVSAFGWLPLLEELYVSPPEDFKSSPEHSHKWDDVMISYSELDPWEIEEPEYYKCKSPSPERMDEDEEVKEESEPAAELPLGDALLGNCMSCPALERRIIVIHPNRQNQNRDQPGEDRQAPEPVPGPSNEGRASSPQPGPSSRGDSPPKRGTSPPDPESRPAASASGYKLRKKPETATSGSAEPVAGPSNSPPKRKRETQPAPKSVTFNTLLDFMKKPRVDKKTQAEDSNLPPKDESRPAKRRRSVEPNNNELKRSGVKLEDQPSRLVEDEERVNGRVPKNIKEETDGKNPGAADERPADGENDSGRPNTGRNVPPAPKSAQRGRNAPRAAEARIPPYEPDLGPLGLWSRVNLLRDRMPMPREMMLPGTVGDHYYRPLGLEPPENDVPINEYNGPDDADGLDREARLVRDVGLGRPPIQLQPELEHLARLVREPPVLHLDLDFNRHQAPVGRQPIYQVSDSAVVRFGRADNDNVNYVHIGHLPANEQGVRPDRSNLRILSITGFRNITDRSLQHLATAAPHIRLIDFSNTSVTVGGVEMFRALRPNCEVIFTDKEKGKSM